MRSNLLLFGIILSNSRRPGSLWADAFRGHGLSLLALAKGMSTLFAKNGFSRPFLKYCGVFRHVLFPQMFSVGRVIADPGVNGPQLQTTIVIVNASFTVLMPSTMLAKEIDEDSL